MKFFKFIFSLIIIAAIGIALITTRPTKSDFAEYYVSQNQTNLGGFFNDAFEKVVIQKTQEQDYLVFSVFEVDEDDRYVGIFGRFFGKSSTEQAAQTAKKLIELVANDIEDK